MKVENTGTVLGKGFTVRAVVWGIIVGVIVQAGIYYMYMAMGFDFSASFLAILLAMIFIPIIGGKASKFEVNIAQTTGSAFAAAAAAMSTTYIAAMQFGYDFNWLVFPVIALLGAVMGFCVNSLLRRHLLYDKNLVFPESVACAKVIEKVEKQSKFELKLLIIGVGAAFFVTILQEVAFILPSNIDITRFLPDGFIFRISLAALPIGIGYILGKKIGLFMLIGALITNIIYAPAGYSLGWFVNPAVDYSAFSQFNVSAFLGITILGTIVFMFKNLKFKELTFKLSKPKINDAGGVFEEVPLKLVSILFATAFVVTIVFFYLVFATNPLMILLAVILSIFLTYVVIRIKEQTGMGVFTFFHLIVLLVVILIVRDAIIAILVVSVTTGLSAAASDTLTDYKTGQIINARPIDLFKAQFIGLIPGVFVGTGLMYLMILTRGIGTAEAPYVFAQLYYGTAAALTGAGDVFLNLNRFLVGGALGALLSVFGLPYAVIGVAHYLPMEIMMAGGLAGLVRGYVDKKWGEDLGQRYINLAGGLILGFSLVIVLALIVSLFTGTAM